MESVFSSYSRQKKEYSQKMFNCFFQFVRIECLLVLPEPENLRAKHTRKVSILKPVLIFG